MQAALAVLWRKDNQQSLRAVAERFSVECFTLVRRHQQTSTQPLILEFLEPILVN
jgi:hypothetical protein